jgi:hypothetical protein
VVLQACFSDLYSSVCKQFQNGAGCVMSGQIIFLAISLIFFRIDELYCVFHVVLYSGITLYELTYFCWCNNNERTNQVELSLLIRSPRQDR